MGHGIAGEDAFEPAAMRLASKVLLGMEWFVIARQTGSNASY